MASPVGEEEGEAQAQAQTLPKPTSRPGSGSVLQEQQPILIRPARLFEAHHVGRIAAATYYDTPLTQFLSPRRGEYYADYERGFTQRAQARMLSPRNVTLFAYEASQPARPVGYVQFVRLGDDGPARAMDRDAGPKWWRLALWGMGWAWWLYTRSWLAGRDRSADLEADEAFEGMLAREGGRYWGVGRLERASRWHAQSVVVAQGFQGRRVGKRLVAEVLGRADEEGVVVGLEASRAGEPMYRSLGFELLGRFGGGVDFEGGAGGFMMRRPKRWVGTGTER
ncbi:hypothetical protein LZ554_008239 [Drepanopeziza brunnea f. sp. 'monogermtubi']|nr:hypothetical protein LZ554_008239 [Drepanopeziza brunnea f. sp. 'monogermtubi']